MRYQCITSIDGELPDQNISEKCRFAAGDKIFFSSGSEKNNKKRVGWVAHTISLDTPRQKMAGWVLTICQKLF
jgi:hypothetical protein